MQHEILDRSDDDLIAVARAELSDLIGLSGTPVVTHVVRWNEAMPQYHVGHLDRVERIEREIESIPGLTLVGNAFKGVGIAAVVRSADKAADDVISSFTQLCDASDSDGVDAAAST